MSSSGLKLAIRYALPPCRLGFCGPHDDPNRQTLYKFVSGENVSPSKVRGVLERFEAMHPYLSLIASCNRISDSFDERVVRALWVGNKLLEAVNADDLKELILTDFVKPALLSKEEAKKRASMVVEGMVPHHSFHVFVLGSITGRVNLGGALKELCRIGWGEVIEVRDSKLKVKSKLLIMDGKMRLGKEVEREMKWDASLAPGIAEGDWVSFHWGRICDRLDKDEASSLEHYTLRTFNALSK